MNRPRLGTIIIYAVYLYAATQNIDLNGKDNCNYRKTGLDEAQPDASFYIRPLQKLNFS